MVYVQPIPSKTQFFRPSIFSVSWATFRCSSRSPELEFWQLVASWSIRCDSHVTSRPGTDPSTETWETWEIWEIWDDWDAIFSSKSSFSWSRLVSTYFTNFSKVFFSTFSTFSTASSWFTRSVSSVTSCGCSSSTLEIWTCWMPKNLWLSQKRKRWGSWTWSVDFYVSIHHYTSTEFYRYTSIEFYRYIMI